MQMVVMNDRGWVMIENSYCLSFLILYCLQKKCTMRIFLSFALNFARKKKFPRTGFEPAISAFQFISISFRFRFDLQSTNWAIEGTIISRIKNSHYFFKETNEISFRLLFITFLKSGGKRDGGAWVRMSAHLSLSLSFSLPSPFKK